MSRANAGRATFSLSSLGVRDERGIEALEEHHLLRGEPVRNHRGVQLV